MTELAPAEGYLKKLPSVDDVRPVEEGGPEARIGFSYQDEIGVSFLIDMLEDPNLLKVHCETHDDIVLVRAKGHSNERVAEFVQVKAGELDKLWSVADLCARTKGEPGTSIFEKSLERDKHLETSQFRLVTLRPVVSVLELLTFPLGSPGREANGARFMTVRVDIDQRCPNTKSLKGNGSGYWLENCFWDQRHSEDAVRKDNLLRLIRLGINEKRPVLPEPAEVLLEELRTRVNSAGKAKWEPNRDKTIITREELRSWWEQRTGAPNEGAVNSTGGRLIDKMKEAKLPPDVIALAVELRRDYARDARTPHYMEREEGKGMQSRVKSEVLSLRARFVAGLLEDLDSAGFHSLCIDRMDAINADRPEGTSDKSAFLKGCMYDIADRCLLRFTRPAV
ncbi:MAG TPA: dsDNA nuclease domain-containing protein [Symbiobacteriaceae bacterium]|nr:dsDNA nuclease domain-containing protein [Symbiobacteriaceae bacterium]